MLERCITALISTAYMDEASRFQRLCLMFEGQAVAAGRPDEIGRDISGTIVQVRARPQLAALAELKREFAMLEARGSWTHVFVEDAEAEQAVGVVEKAIGDAEIEEARTSDPGLEDLFIAMLRKRGFSEKSTAPSDVERREAKDWSEAEPAVTAEGLTKEFGDFRAVDRISLEVGQGEIFGLLGANGAGKTTAIKMLVGILPPTEGGGSVAGADIRHAGKVKSSIGYMSQIFSLYGDLRVIENIRLYGGIYGLSGRRLRTRTDELVHMADLEGVTDALAERLPVGIRQRLALACALVHEPGVLFLDEPTSGVDPIGRRRFWDLLYTLSRQDGVAIVITTHYMNEAEHCDRLAMMHAGKVIADDTPAALKDKLTEDKGSLLEVQARDFLGALEAIKDAGFDSASLHGRSVHLLARDEEAARERIEVALSKQDLGLRSIEKRRVGMEDVFVQRMLEMEQAQNAEEDA
jgi:ABC-2 type transport system ATP-binding protein